MAFNLTIEVQRKLFIVDEDNRAYLKSMNLILHNCINKISTILARLL